MLISSDASAVSEKAKRAIIPAETADDKSKK